MLLINLPLLVLLILPLVIFIFKIIYIEIWILCELLLQFFIVRGKLILLFELVEKPFGINVFYDQAEEYLQDYKYADRQEEHFSI